MMLRTALASAMLVAVAVAPASAANLVTNGSFENGANGLLGWAQTGANAGFPAVSIFYGQAVPYPNGAFGEAVPADNAISLSPDPVGLRAAYFVDDFAVNQALSQTVFLNAGTYEIGFDAYAPQNGFNNAGDATFTGVVAGITLASYAVSSGTPLVWQNFSSQTTIATAGNYAVNFTFNTNQSPSKDVVIDRVYILDCSVPGTCSTPATDVPEPASIALLGLGLAGIGLLRRRRRAAA